MGKKIIIIKWGALLGAGLSLINLIGFFLEKAYYFAPVRELLEVLTIVSCLYLAIRDIRDKAQDGLIKFPKAFGIGSLVIIISYLILSLYMTLQLGVIEKNGVERINRQFLEAATKSIMKDTATTAELKQYHLTLKQTALKDAREKVNDDSLKLKNDSTIVAILRQHEYNLTKRYLNDSLFLQLDSFDIRADQMLRNTIYSMRIANPEINDTCFNAVENARDSMAENPIWKQRLKTQNIPQYHTAFEAAFVSSLAALLYGLLINIFVALFLYRKEKTICSRNNNDPMAPEEETPAEEDSEKETTETDSEEKTAEEK